MKFTFDGNIYENNNSSQDLKSDQKIILSGLIFESNTRLAALPFESEVKSFLKLDPLRRSEFMMDVWSKKSKADQAAFMDTWSKLDKNPSGPETSDEDKKNKGLDGFIDQMQGIANKPTGVDELAKTLECRYYVIQRLKSQIDTQKIGFYFTNLMSKQNLTEEKTCAILNRGADIANNTGARVENVLDFVVAAYDRIKSITLLDQFLKRAESVLEKNRTIPVFQLLNKAVNGEKANTRAYLMTIKDPQQMIILNELMTMVQAGPVENMEQLRRSWQASLDKVERQTEIYDRRIKVYNMFKSEAANYGMAHVIQSLGSLFKIFQKTGLLDVITNIFYDLRAGQLATDAALSPITRNPVNYPVNQPGAVNSYNTEFRAPIGHTGAKFIKTAQQEQPSQPQNSQASSPKALFDSIIFALRGLLSDPTFTVFFPVIQGAISILSKFDDKTTLDDIMKAFSDFMAGKDKFNIQGATEQTSTPVTASIANSNIRLALGPALARLGPVLGPMITTFVRNQLTILADDPALLVKFLLSLSELIISIIRTYGAAFWGKDLKRDPMFFDSAGRFLQNSPAAIAYTQTLSEAGYSTDQINAMITFKQVREQVKEKIRNYETKVKDVLAIPVQTGVNTTSESPLKSDASIQKITNGFILELRGAIVQFDKEIDFLRNLASEAQMQQRNQVALNLVTQHLREAEADLQNMKNLLGRYYSYDLTIANRNKTMQLMKVIGPMMSRINKFQTVGISTAALISNPQGIFPILNKIRQMQLDNIAKMKADLDVKKRSLPDNYYLEP
jgi:hypothetical protein